MRSFESKHVCLIAMAFSCLYTAGLLMASAQTSSVETDLAKAKKQWQTELDDADKANDEGRYGDAERFLKEALSVLMQSVPLVQKDGSISAAVQHAGALVQVRMLLAAVYDAQGKFADADPEYEWLLAQFENSSSLKHKDAHFAVNLAMVLDMSGLHYQKARRLDKAEPLLRRALTTLEKVGGREASKIAGPGH